MLCNWSISNFGEQPVFIFNVWEFYIKKYKIMKSVPNCLNILNFVRNYCFTPVIHCIYNVVMNCIQTYSTISRKQLFSSKQYILLPYLQFLKTFCFHWIYNDDVKCDRSRITFISLSKWWIFIWPQTVCCIMLWGGGQLKREVGEEGVGGGRRGGGRWEWRGWEVGERGEGGGREECGRKK